VEVIEMAVKLVNLTPHPVVIILAEGGEITVPPSGTVARVKEIVEDVGQIVLDDGTVVPLRRKFLANEVEGLPDPADDTIYIASFLAAQAAWTMGRTDVVSTGDPVRDENGRIIGVTSLYVKP
jgi:hypothetical protein